MSKLINPYEILEIEDFASEDIIEAAFNKRIAEFEGIQKFTKKQAELFSLIHEAYDILSNQSTKKMVDDELRLNNIHQKNLRVTDNLSPLDEVNSQADSTPEVELSREKNIGPQGKANNKSIFTYFIYAVIAVVVGGFFLNLLEKNKIAEKEKIAEKTKPPVEEEKKEAIAPIALIANATSIKNNIFYPDPAVFQKPNLIYAPDGSVFPLEAGLIPTLPQLTNGEGSIVVSNPHSTAIYGKLIVQFSDSSDPMVIRNFYIPSKQTLEIFNTPTGKFQIQILTLDKPVAYVSPIFNVPLYSEAKTVKNADWAYPHSPDSVF